MAPRYRPAIPLLVKYLAVLRHFGLEPADIEFDHCPPLGLREYDEATRTYIPPANDPDKIVMRLKPDHRAKTSHPLGPHTTAGSDQHMIHKTLPKQTDKFLVDKKPLAMPAAVIPGQKCRGCGEMSEDCTCPPRAERQSAFGRVRRA